ncbi:MAG TPA: class I SAM-dependent methyltransferase [Methanomassiliicoccales archaeon]
MAHQFKAGNKEMLKGLPRREVQPAEEIVERASPRTGEVCADLGAGTGYISIPLSREVKAVVALDSQREMLDTLGASLAPGQGENIWPLLGELPELPFADGSLDRIFVVNVLHEFEDRDRFVKEIRRALKEGGRVSLVDFQKRPTSFGPPVEERIDIGDVEAIFAGFISLESWSFDEFYQFELARD